MKIKAELKSFSLACVLVVAALGPAIAQQPTAQPQEKEPAQRRGILSKIFGQDPKPKKSAPKEGTAPASSSSQRPSERLEPDDTNPLPSSIPAEVQAGRRGQSSEEEAAVLPYYNNFLTTYRLGPEDIISVTVFGQERYSKSNITVPPDGRISYPLIPEGIFVGGKTTRQVQDEIAKQYDEYIIEPKVTVTLEKAMSARYSVLGDVAQPGIRIMTHRLSVYEALAEAGGVLNTGDKSKVFILRRQPDGNLRPIFVDIKKIERGQAKEMAFLSAGDQVVVPGNRFKTFEKLVGMLPILSFARIFTGGF